jgi:hypothetical protein
MVILGIILAASQTAGVLSEVDFPPCLRAFFQPFFPEVDFQQVNLLVGLPWHLEKIGFVAVAIGRDIYISRRYFDLCSPSGVAILGHELYHVRQGWNYPLGFLAGYSVEFLTSGLEFGLGNRFELPAYLFQYRLLAGFREIRAETEKPGPCCIGDGRGANSEFIAQWIKNYGLGFSERFFQIEIPSRWLKEDFGLSDEKIKKYQDYRPDQ